jgi:hypothetical protein
VKRVLVVGYSQTGQLDRVLDAVSQPLNALEDVELVRAAIVPLKPYPFPWSLMTFFDQFPEAVALQPTEIAPLPVSGRFDLVILGYQPWFLSPSIPTTSFLKSPQARSLLQDTPLITLVGCRNMWGQAHLDMAQLLAPLGAKWIDNVVLQDQGGAIETFITTPRWLLSGQKDACCGLSAAGIADQEIARSARFGRAIGQALQTQPLPLSASILQGLGAVKAQASLLQSEKIGKRSFRLWGRLLRALGPQGAWARKPVLVLYIVFLVLMIVTVVPISMALRRLLAPFNHAALTQLETDFEQPSGSDSRREKEFL